jgi:hypothetical protein
MNQLHTKNIMKRFYTNYTKVHILKVSAWFCMKYGLNILIFQSIPNFNKRIQNTTVNEGEE